MNQSADPSPRTNSKKSKTGRKNEYLTDNPRIPHESIREALFNVQDILERSQIQFMLLDELAKQIAEGEDPDLSSSEISLGVMRQDFTESGSSTLRSLVPDAGWRDFRHDEELSNISYTYGSVPVVIWIIHNKMSVFDNPETKYYYQTEFRIPNPFKEYWRKRDLVR